MLIIPILYQNKIYNVELKLKNAYEAQDSGVFEKRYESDVVVNGRSYNGSSYYVKNAPINNVIQFIRDNALYTNTSSFTLTSRRNSQGKMKTLRVATPLPHITDGLDALYSSAVQNIKRDIPGHSKDRNLSLKGLGVTEHITDKKLKRLQKAISSKSSVMNMESSDDTVNELYQTLEFLGQFECTIIDEATVDVKSVQGMMIPLSGLNTTASEEVRKYYRMAQENSNEYAKLEYMARLLTGEPLYWIREEKNITKIKSWDRNDRKVA